MTTPQITQPIYSNSSSISVRVDQVTIGDKITCYIYKNNKPYKHYSIVATSSVIITTLNITFSLKDYFSVKVYNQRTFNLSSYSNIVYVTTINLPQNTYFENMLNNTVSKDDTYIQKWVDGILDKVSGGELLPSFVIWQNSDGTMNEDFENFWRSVAEYFAYYVTAAKNINLNNNVDFIKNYLSQRGLFLSGEESLIELSALKANFYKLINKRGTSLELPDISNLLTETTNYQSILHQNQEIGWKVGFSSPLSLSNSHNLFSLDKLGTIQQQVLEVVRENTGAFVKIYNSFIPEADVFSPSKAIKIDSNLNYDFIINARGNSTLQVSIYCFDYFGILYDIVNVKDGTINKVIFNKSLTTDFKLFKSTIFNSNKIISNKAGNSVSNINNLKLSPNIEYIQIEIKTSTVVEIKDIIFKLTEKAKSTGYINASNIVSMWFRSNNDTLPTEQALDTLKQNYLPYNSHLLVRDTSKTNKGLCEENLGNTPIYVFTGNVRCGEGLFIQEEFVDINICSNSYNQLRYIDTSESCSSVEIIIDLIEVITSEIELCDGRDVDPIWEFIGEPYCIQ